MISLSNFGTDGGLLQSVLLLYSLPGTKYVLVPWIFSQGPFLGKNFCFPFIVIALLLKLETGKKYSSFSSNLEPVKYCTQVMHLP